MRRERNAADRDVTDEGVTDEDVTDEDVTDTASWDAASRPGVGTAAPQLKRSTGTSRAGDLSAGAVTPPR